MSDIKTIVINNEVYLRVADLTDFTLPTIKPRRTAKNWAGAELAPKLSPFLDLNPIALTHPVTLDDIRYLPGLSSVTNMTLAKAIHYLGFRGRQQNNRKVVYQLPLTETALSIIKEKQ